MNNGNISYSSIAILLFTVLLSSCLKETAVPIESVFSIETQKDKTSPVTILLKNDDDGADVYVRPSKLRMPSGNEIGTDELLWIPGGLTSGGIPELVMDFSLKPKFLEIKIH